MPCEKIRKVSEPDVKGRSLFLLLLRQTLHGFGGFKVRNTVNIRKHKEQPDAAQRPDNCL